MVIGTVGSATTIVTSSDSSATHGATPDTTYRNARSVVTVTIGGVVSVTSVVLVDVVVAALVLVVASTTEDGVVDDTEVVTPVSGVGSVDAVSIASPQVSCGRSPAEASVATMAKGIHSGRSSRCGSRMTAQRSSVTPISHTLSPACTWPTDATCSAVGHSNRSAAARTVPAASSASSCRIANQPAPPAASDPTTSAIRAPSPLTKRPHPTAPAQ